MAMNRGSGRVPTVPSLRLERQFSVKEAEASSKLLTSIEHGDIEDLHLLLSKLPEGITSVLNTPSLLVKHKLRTPLMAAAATGDFPRFTATLHAFDRQFPNKLHRDFEMRTQLTNRDREGMNIVMLAAKSSSMAILGAVLTEVDQTEALSVLDMHDHKQMTVLMHTVRNGPAPLFQEVRRAMRKSFGDDGNEFGRHLLLKSADDKTILMHAAASGDPMVLKMVADACQKTIMPQTLREMIVERDSDGLNLLMHAASCSAPPSALLPPEPLLVDPDTSDKKDGDTATGSASNNGSGSTKPAAKDQLAGVLKKASATGATLSTAATDTSASLKNSLEQMIAADEVDTKNAAVVVPVFKVAVRLVKQTLWKDEVLQQLKAVDLWGRSVLTHALLSGHELVFEAAYGAVRDDVNDEQVSEMMETNEGEREDTPMIEALAMGDVSMRKLYALRAGQVKKDVDMRSKLSSMDAKIESFIPGKLVVMFQLLLPQIAEGRQLFLLYIMCAIAPLMKLAAGSTDPDSKHQGISPRSNKLSVFLGAPAMFFWGVGTSTVGSRLGWSSALSATSMAAATLVIPAIDSFFNSRKANQLGDKLCCKEWRFNWKAYRHWRSIRNTTPRKPPQNELPTYSTFGAAEPETASSQGVEEEKRSAPPCSVCSTAAAPLPEQELPGTTTALTPREAPKDSFHLSDEA